MELEVAWGDTLCNLCRFRLAELVEDNREPLCIGCADLILERGELVALIGAAEASRLASLEEIARLS